MKKAISIDIRNYRSNIEVFARFARTEDNGRIFTASTNADSYPTASSIPTIRQIWEDCDKQITLEQAREIKQAIYDNCRHWFRR